MGPLYKELQELSQVVLTSTLVIGIFKSLYFIYEKTAMAKRVREADAKANLGKRLAAKSYFENVNRNWQLPFASVRIKLLATVATDLQHILKGVQE